MRIQAGMYLKKLSTKLIFRDQLWSTWDGDYMIPGFEIETSDHPFETYYTLWLYGTFTSLLSEVTATASYEKSTNLKLNNFKLHCGINLKCFLPTLSSIRRHSVQPGICLNFLAPKVSFSTLWGIFRQYGGKKTTFGYLYDI